MSARSEELAEYQEIETAATHDFAAGFIVPSGIEMLRDVAGRIVTCISGSIPATAEQGRECSCAQRTIRSSSGHRAMECTVYPRTTCGGLRYRWREHVHPQR